MLLGGSRWSEPACASVARFAERFALPVATTFRRAHLFDPAHPCYAGDLGIGPNPKLLARVKGADLILLVGGRLGEMPSEPHAPRHSKPRQTLHVFPGVELRPGRIFPSTLPGLPWRSKPCSRPTSCAGKAKPRMPTSRLDNQPTACPARSISARLSQACAKCFPPMR
jgi:hypothetical protein